MRVAALLSDLKIRFTTYKFGWSPFLSSLMAFALFWVLLHVKIPYLFTTYFHSFSPGAFLLVFACYVLSFRLPGQYRFMVGLAITMTLFALTLSYLWTSGYSDNKIIAGLLPYKDGAGYYSGAYLILNGFSLENTLQAGWRPLFPGFLSSLLLFTGGNLKYALAILVALAGIGAFSSSLVILNRFGALPAGLFLTFLYFYIQPLIGLTMTELWGFTLGCLAFSLLWKAADELNVTNMILGLLALVLALSVRAGTFFMLPLLAVWAGRFFRGDRRFSFPVFAAALIVTLAGYLAANLLYVRWIGVPEGTAFGNFAYSLYGQVRGGTGWHFAIEELGTRDPSVIYREALQFFLKHPLSLLIGIAKAYRDFLLPQERGIFPFHGGGNLWWVNYILWAGSIALLIRAVLTHRYPNLRLLILAGSLGFLLSIPFLPPIDGGSRFYASSVPFFFVLPALGFVRSPAESPGQEAIASSRGGGSWLRFGTIAAWLLTLIMPLLVQRINSASVLAVPACSAGEKPFVIRTYPDSYVDLVADTTACGIAPNICLADFLRNGTERDIDDFYQALSVIAQESATTTRIIPAVNLLDEKFHFFQLVPDKISSAAPSQIMSGCAIETNTRTQSIYQIQSLLEGTP